MHQLMLENALVVPGLPQNLTSQECRGLMVKASGWQSFDRQFDPYPRAIRWRPCGAALDAVPNLMVENINKGFFLRRTNNSLETDIWFSFI
jgi:hypothetical protein